MQEPTSLRPAVVLAAFCALASGALADDKAATREAACARKPTPTEQAICTDRGLTRRDAELNEVYGALRAKAEKEPFALIRDEQRRWLRERNRCGRDLACLEEKYADRLYVLENALEGLAFPDKGHVEIGGPHCDEFGKLRSESSSEKVSVTFTNRSGEYRALMWLDFEGRPVDYAALADGESYTASTFAGHICMLTDGPGNCIEMVTAAPGVSSYSITRKSPGFGDSED